MRASRLKAQGMESGLLAFKKSDVVRAIKAVQAAGLAVVRTEIYTDGRIVFQHHAKASAGEREERQSTL